MSARCPEGHLSDSLDYCDVCGSPMGAGGDGDSVAQPPSEGTGAAAPDLPDPDGMTGAATQTCPHCGALNVADALFCEACGYDFTTGTPPMGSHPAPAATSGEEEALADEVAPAGGEAVEGDGDQGDGDVAERISTIVDIASGQTPDLHNATAADTETDEGTDTGTDEGTDTGTGTGTDSAPDAESDGADAPSAPVTSTDPASRPTKEGHSAVSSEGEQEEEVVEPVLEPAHEPEPQPEPEPETEPEREPQPAAQPAVPAHRKARHTPPSRALTEAWVVELWVDPDWYAVQQTEEACPSAGVPDIVLLTRSTALIGRPSGSLGARPEIDAGADSAVSRRHAQLTSDGRRWWVEDLGSSNGTFVGTVGEPLPTKPLTPGQRVEIDRDDRLYVGAWTRIVLRQATASEQQGTG